MERAVIPQFTRQKAMFSIVVRLLQLVGVIHEKLRSCMNANDGTKHILQRSILEYVARIGPSGFTLQLL